MDKVKHCDKKLKWRAWHKENPHVYDTFEKYAFDVIDAGKKKTSAWLIINRIRWEYEIETKGSEFKISNDYIAYYSRLFMAYHPEHQIFNIKPFKHERGGSYE